MSIDLSYKRILILALPIMIGSIVQNAIALMDSLFLFYLSEDDFASIGFVSAFYLIIISVGYGFSRGGQIVMAKLDGGSQYRRIGIAFNTNLFMLLILATIFFVFVRFGSPWLLKYIVSNDIIYAKSIEYLHYRSYGVYSGFMILGMVALYTGVANTGFLVIATGILLSTNLFFNYGLIFGNFGFPKMGISGAAIASNIAEIAGLISFSLHILFSKDFKIFHLPARVFANFNIAKDILKISMPLVLQTSAGVISWFALFSLVENMGQRELAISNLARVFYLLLSIPLWGFSVSVNTLVSNSMGAKMYDNILVIVRKTSVLALGMTFFFAIPLLLYPEFFVRPLLNDEQMVVLYEAKDVLRLLLGILVVYILGTVIFQGMIGTGNVLLTLSIQLVCVSIYVSLLFMGVKLLGFTMLQAWSLEIFYWSTILIVNIVYFKYYFNKENDY